MGFIYNKNILRLSRRLLLGVWGRIPVKVGLLGSMHEVGRHIAMVMGFGATSVYK